MSFDDRLRLIMITDGAGDLPRLRIAVREAFAGGCRCVQVREPGWSGRQLWDACAALRPVVKDHEGLLLVNDRLDLARAGGADGAQVGHRSLPPDAARRALGSGRLLGFSAHDDAELAAAARAGCDFALLSPVWPTDCKPGAQPLGVARAASLTAGASLPVIWLGGVTPAVSADLRALAPSERPQGLAAMSGVLDSADPAEACRLLLDALP